MSTIIPRYISIAAALSLFAQSATALVAPAASAADMLDGPAQETTQVEYGTGWYLRGEISGTVSGDYFISETSTAINAAGQQEVSTVETDAAFTYGVGVGYRFTDSVRADLGYRYMGSGSQSTTTTGIAPAGPCLDTFELQSTFFGESQNITDNHTIENCIGDNSNSYDLQAFMANAYYDFDAPIMGIRPFVGLGVGVIRNQFVATQNSITCVPNSFERCNPRDGGIAEFGEPYIEEGERTNGTSYHLAGAIHAGFAVPIAEDVYFDTSYTYTRMAEEASFGGSNGVDISGAPSDFHSLRLGVRVEIW